MVPASPWKAPGCFGTPFPPGWKTTSKSLWSTHSRAKRCPHAKRRAKPAKGWPSCFSTASCGPVSFRPPGPRRLRDLPRPRSTLTEERSRVSARRQKGGEDAKSQLASVESGGEGDLGSPAAPGSCEGESFLLPPWPNWPEGRCDPGASTWLRLSRATARLSIACSLRTMSLLLPTESRPGPGEVAELAERLAPSEASRLRLETIPGLQRRLAEILLAAMGPERTRFPSAAPLAGLRRNGPWQP